MKTKTEIKAREDELKHLKFKLQHIYGIRNLKTNIDDWLEALNWVLGEDTLKQIEENGRLNERKQSQTDSKIIV